MFSLFHYDKGKLFSPLVEYTYISSYFFQFIQIILKLQQCPKDFRCLLSAVKVVVLQTFMISFFNILYRKKKHNSFINNHRAQTINHKQSMSMLYHRHGLLVLSNMDSTCTYRTFENCNKAKHTAVLFECFYSELYNTQILRAVSICISHTAFGTAHRRLSKHLLNA